MFIKGLTLVVLLCVVLAVFCLAFPGTAYAQDEDFMQRKGLDGLLSSAKSDPTKAAKSWQIALGVGSCFVMVAVVKWL